MDNTQVTLDAIAGVASHDPGDELGRRALLAEIRDAAARALAGPGEGEARLTEKQREFLAFVREFRTRHGYGPSYRDVMARFGFRSTFSVRCHLNVLVRKGVLRFDPRVARSMVTIP